LNDIIADIEPMRRSITLAREIGEADRRFVGVKMKLPARQRSTERSA